MTEIRTTSSTGGEKGVKAERHDLIPRKGVAAIARVFAFGANKYADHNWRRGYEWGKSIAALDRHFSDFADGKTYDLCEDGCEFYDENGGLTCRNHSGLHHLAHAGFHILVLLTWHEEQGEGNDNLFDDRWPHSMARSRLMDAYRAGGPIGELLVAFGISEDTFGLMLQAYEADEPEPETTDIVMNLDGTVLRTIQESVNQAFINQELNGIIGREDLRM